MHTSRLYSQAGFSLVEILLVIGLIASIAIGAFIIYPIVSSAKQVNEIADKVVLIDGSIKQFFSGRTLPTTGVTATSLISAGVFEQADANTAHGSIEIANSPQKPGYRIAHRNLPQNICKKLVARLEPLASIMNVGTPDASTTIVKSSTVAFNPLTAAARCTGTTSNNIIFMWSY